jgi:hypothetical protein
MPLLSTSSEPNFELAVITTGADEATCIVDVVFGLAVGLAVVVVVDAVDGCAPDVTLPEDDPQAANASTADRPSALIMIFICIATNRRPLRSPHSDTADSRRRFTTAQPKTLSMSSSMTACVVRYKQTGA